MQKTFISVFFGLLLAALMETAFASPDQGTTFVRATPTATPASPECATPCRNDFSGIGCKDENDFSCLCRSDVYRMRLAACLCKSCPTKKEQDAAIDVAYKVCLAFGVRIDRRNPCSNRPLMARHDGPHGEAEPAVIRVEYPSGVVYPPPAAAPPATGGSPPPPSPPPPAGPPSAAGSPPPPPAGPPPAAGVPGVPASPPAAETPAVPPVAATETPTSDHTVIPVPIPMPDISKIAQQATPVATLTTVLTLSQASPSGPIQVVPQPSMMSSQQSGSMTGEYPEETAWDSTVTMWSTAVSTVTEEASATETETSTTTATAPAASNAAQKVSGSMEYLYSALMVVLLMWDA